jgi:predicted metal-binding membrane protein
MVDSGNSLERLLNRDSSIIIGCLIAITLLAWLYIVTLAQGMARGDMSLMGIGSSGALANLTGSLVVGPMPWTLSTFGLMVVMWWFMMIGMMVPSAAPMILIFARVQRKKLTSENPSVRIALFTLGYLLLWLAFSLVATLLQWGFGFFALLTSKMVSSSTYLGVAIFFAAGIYQLTPLKQACLAKCQSPIIFISSHWRDGDWGAFKMGLAHGAYCVGCCWFLMGLLFFGGVMNLVWIAIIAIIVLLEKILPRGRLFSQASGIGMICFSVLLLLQ